MKNLKGVFLLTAIVILSSCPAKAQSASPSDMAKAFSDAGVPLLRQTVAARDFSLPVLPAASVAASMPTAGETQNLAALKGKVVFLNFWATWCGPCRAEMPSIEALYGKYRDKGLEILAVNCMEKSADVLAFMEDNGFSFPVALDNEGKVNRAYGIQAIPTTFLIDREGRIVLRLVGSIDWNTPKFHAALDLLLNSGQPPQT